MKRLDWERLRKTRKIESLIKREFREVFSFSCYNVFRGLIMEENELDSTCGISDDELTKRFIESVRIENEIKKAKGVPISEYDIKSKKAYLVYPDGTKKYVNAKKSK